MKTNEYIFSDPTIRFGKPCVKNTRISVFDVHQWIESGMSMEDIIQDFPELNEDSIKACLAYPVKN